MIPGFVSQRAAHALRFGISLTLLHLTLLANCPGIVRAVRAALMEPGIFDCMW